MSGNRQIRILFFSWTVQPDVRGEIIGETPRKYKVRLIDDFPLYNWKAGDIVSVPQIACIVTTPPATSEPGDERSE